MVERTKYGPRWEQPDYYYMKDALEGIDGASVNGSANSTVTDTNPAINIDIGKYQSMDGLKRITTRVLNALREAGMNPRETAVKAGYRGAHDQALLLEVEFEYPVYDEGSDPS